MPKAQDPSSSSSSPATSDSSSSASSSSSHIVMAAAAAAAAPSAAAGKKGVTVSSSSSKKAAAVDSSSSSSESSPVKVAAVKPGTTHATASTSANSSSSDDEMPDAPPPATGDTRARISSSSSSSEDDDDQVVKSSGKKAAAASPGDSLDLVVIGAYTDNMRADRFASYLLGCYEDSTGQFQSMCRVACLGPTGDEPDALAVRCRALVIPAASPRYSLTVTGSFPDVWIDAKIVVEVACAMLSLSANHTAASGLVDPVKGISALFPRLVRERADKTPEEATTAEQVALMFKAQVNESGVV